MATCYTPSDRRYSDMILDEFDARPAIAPLRYVIVCADDDTAWTDTDSLSRARDVADALARDGHGAFEVLDREGGFTAYTSK